jgi:N,N-dimethylformamidase
MSWSGTRRRLLTLAALGTASLLRRKVPGAEAQGPLVTGFRIDNGAQPFAGDSSVLTTLRGGSNGMLARLRFSLREASDVSLEVLQTGQGVASERPVTVGQSAMSELETTLAAGSHVLEWSPGATLPARTYILLMTAQTKRAGARPVASRAVARLLGIDAGFAVRSSTPGETTPLVIRAAAGRLTLQMLRSGGENEPTYANGEIKGVPVGAPFTLEWAPNRNQSATVPVPIGADWPSGVYAAQLAADDGRLGFAPVIVRPVSPTQRVAVVMPTTTWQAYNFYDSDGDGWGDTWYARWKTHTVDLLRPHAGRGVPYRYRSYDLSFQHWLAQTGKAVDTFADEDLELFLTPEALRAAYDLLVFPGHTEYVTQAVYDLVTGFRDLGGNLIFLSANNFFRRVDRNGQRLTLIDEWRDLGRPEAALLGVQYIASDRGERHAPFTIVGAAANPWAFDGTGLTDGGQFGLYGIEIDARAPSSPPGVQVLATIPDLFGAGKSAEMTYYEHASGAKVFSAGALNFGGQVLLWPQTARLLENVWQRCA